MKQLQTHTTTATTTTQSSVCKSGASPLTRCLPHCTENSTRENEFLLYIDDILFLRIQFKKLRIYNYLFFFVSYSSFLVLLSRFVCFLFYDCDYYVYLYSHLSNWRGTPVKISLRGKGEQNIEYVEQFELLLTTLFVIVLVFFLFYKLFFFFVIFACVSAAMRDDSASIYKGKLPESIFFILIFAVLCSTMCCVSLCVCVRVCVWLICVCLCVRVVCLLLLLLLFPSSPPLHSFRFSACLFICFSNVAFLHRATPKVLSTTQTTHLPHTHCNRRQSVNSLWKWSLNF